MPCHVTLNHTRPPLDQRHHVTPCQTMSHTRGHTVSHHITITWSCHVTPCHTHMVTPCHTHVVTPCHTMSHTHGHTMSHHVTHTRSHQITLKHTTEHARPQSHQGRYPPPNWILTSAPTPYTLHPTLCHTQAQHLSTPTPLYTMPNPGSPVPHPGSPVPHPR